MAKTIQVTPEELEKTAGAIEGLASDYQASYKKLYSTTDSMATTWQGKDNVAYTSQIAGFKDDFDKMHQLMLDYASFLRKSADAYRKTQDAVVTEAKKLRN